MGLTIDDLRKRDAEFIIVLKGYDDTFSQEVNSVFSYGPDEIVWNAKFEMMYEETDDSTHLRMDRLSDYVEL